MLFFMSVFGKMGDYISEVAAKILTEVEVNSKISNQHEFGDRGGAVRRLLGEQDRRASCGNGIPTVIMYWGDDESPLTADISTTWYDSRRNQSQRSPEWRLYYKDCPPIRKACAGDLMCFGLLNDGRLLILITQHGSSMEAKTKVLFHIDTETRSGFSLHDVTNVDVDAFAAELLETLGFEVRPKDDLMLDEMVRRWGYEFPTNAEFAWFAQDSLKDVDPAHDDPDEVVMAYYDWNYTLFRVFETAVIQHEYGEHPFVTNGIIDVESFTSFYTKVRNRRMSRAGTSLEEHLTRIFSERHIPFKAQGHTEGSRRPDFLFPSQKAYDDPDYPATRLRMLASKTSIKDRFRQVADEANRIKVKHLFTLTPGDVTHSKLDQLNELNLQLVMPCSIRDMYDDVIASRTTLFSDFIGMLESLYDVRGFA